MSPTHFTMTTTAPTMMTRTTLSQVAVAVAAAEVVVGREAKRKRIKIVGDQYIHPNTLGKGRRNELHEKTKEDEHVSVCWQ